MSRHLIEMTNEWHDKVDQADQSILNMVFENNWYELPFDFNHVVLHSHFTDYQLPEGQEYPKVIHYLSHRNMVSSGSANLSRCVVVLCTVGLV